MAQNDMNRLALQIVGGMLIAICSASLSYGYCNGKHGAEVVKAIQAIQFVKEVQDSDRKRTIDEIASIRAASSKHMEVTVNLMSKLVEQNNELIMFLRARMPLVPTSKP